MFSTPEKKKFTSRYITKDFQNFGGKEKFSEGEKKDGYIEKIRMRMALDFSKATMKSGRKKKKEKQQSIFLSRILYSTVGRHPFKWLQ